MSGLESLYLRCPVSVQHLLVSVEGARLERRRYSRGFSNILEEAERFTFATQDDVRALQRERMRNFFKHCAVNVPFYAPYARILQRLLTTYESPEQLRCFPVLTKTDVQRGCGALRPVAGVERAIPVHTSGSTGAGLRFSMTEEAEQWAWATVWRQRRWHEIDFGRWCLYFGGRSVVPPWRQEPPFWRVNHPGRQVMFSAYHLRKETARYYLRHIIKTNATWLHGYPSILALLASYALDGSGFDFHDRIQHVTAAAESLLPQQRELMREAFGVSPINHYGQAEMVAQISECPRGRLHVDEDFSLVEFLPVADGPADAYHIVGTSFLNLAFPLIRYDTGDIARISGGSCSCGRPGRVVDALDGRIEDYIVLSNGTRLGRLDHIFKDMVHVREAQLYQAAAGELEVRIVRTESFGPSDERRLRQEIRKRVGNFLNFDIRYVDTLQHTSAGKLRFVISDTARLAVPR
jgi:phenylacetate-CoA ligase